ncbi:MULTISPECIES: sporulation protein [Paenibacillus]|uniref:Sporulation protein n=1 Tax=Paenibacillus lignilyticus TaxID=1172615 RepID=A0ABS5CM67_9BACL|nr:MULTISPECIES: sporulation protein [Paenibacillus]MBP3966959.1 sporulation protein [Paenibacillus lignilyticus]SFT24112.1 sporulation-control protein [Paenibacillus sp. BC26]
MSMFKRMLASVGIGAAQVDLMLHEDEVQAGDTLSGVVRIQGGRVAQQVDDVYAFVMTRYVKEHNDTKIEEEAPIAKFLLAGKFTVEAEQVYEFPVSFQLPVNTPVTMGRTPVWIQTGLEIKEAIDPKDRDQLQVNPHPYSAVVLDAVRQLGFRIREVTCQYAPQYGRIAGLSFVQEFEFIPTSEFRGQLDELEIVFYPDADGVDLLLQIDRKARGLSGLFSEAFDTDERYVKLRFDRNHLASGASYVADQLADTIRRYI